MFTILFVTNNYTPYSGGLVSSINAFKKGLEQEGNQVFVLTLNFLKQRPIEDESIIRLYCPVRFKYKTNPMVIPWQCTSQMEKVIKQLKPAIIHSHHPFLLGKSGLLCARKFKIPIIFTYHTQYTHYLHNLPLPRFISKPLVEILVNNYCNRVDVIIAPSYTLEHQLKKKNIKTPITVIPSPLDSLFFRQEQSEKKLNDRCHLLTVSRFTQEKNLYFLLDVFSQLPSQFTFTLVGYGPEKDALKYYAFQTLNLSPQVIKFVEKPSREDLYSLYRQSDIFIFASKTETQGIVLAEAMACGLPIVAFQAPGSQDIIQHGINGFLITTQEEMIHYLLLLNDDALLYTQLSDNVQRTSLLFSQHILCKKLIDVYNTLRH